jgi:putative transport protein
MDALNLILTAAPEVALFAALALGCALGRVKLGSFSLGGVAGSLIPLVVALYFGRFVLKLHPVVLLGALCGGQTVAAALSAVNEATESMTPVLGFTVTYAISNVLLAIWGPVIVALT